MRWIAGRVLRPLMWLVWIVLLGAEKTGVRLANTLNSNGRRFKKLGRSNGRRFKKLGRRVESAVSGFGRRVESAVSGFGRKLQNGSRYLLAVSGTLRRLSSEVPQYRHDVRELQRDLAKFMDDQVTAKPLDSGKSTIFLLITCGQAVRNFLLSDVLTLLREKYNVVILSPYANSDAFRKEYGVEGVHVLPWFNKFRTVFERLFEYFFMTKSPSRTHHSWLANLEARAKVDRTQSYRHRRLHLVRKISEKLGGIVGRRGMQGLYGSYYMSHLPKSIFRQLFSVYRPVLVISATSYHTEAWPLTYFARRNGCKTLANVLSWDNTTTKPIMDISCTNYTVWSEEMKREFECQFPHIKAKLFITGCPMFDMYYHKPYAIDREAFLAQLGLAPDKPYILYTTNTPQAMADEHLIVNKYWSAINRSALAGKVSLLVRLHPKDSISRYKSLLECPGVVVTQAAEKHWTQSDHWLPGHEDMCLLLNSILHAAVSVNVASTMSLESFALGVPTINVAFKSNNALKDRGTKWSFDMYHFSEHYHALVDNGAVDIARSMDELLAMSKEALANRTLREEAMRRTLEQKASYCDGTSARRFVEVVEKIAKPRLEAAHAEAEPRSRSSVRPKVAWGQRQPGQRALLTWHGVRARKRKPSGGDCLSA